MPRRLNVELEYQEKLKELDKRKALEIARITEEIEKRYAVLKENKKLWRDKHLAIQAEQKSRKQLTTKPSTPPPSPPTHTEEEVCVEGDVVVETEEQKYKRIFKDCKESFNASFGEVRYKDVFKNGELLLWVQMFIEGSKKLEGKHYDWVDGYLREIKGEKILKKLSQPIPTPEAEPPRPAEPASSVAESKVVEQGEQTVEKIPPPPPPKPYIYKPTVVEQPELPPILSNTKVKKPIKVAGK